MIILKKLIIWLLIFALWMPGFMVSAEEAKASENQVAADVNAPHALLMEVSTGTVLMAKAADEKLHPASVTKIMTMLLILEAIEDGKISLSDMVTVSEHASSMGGSQVYLEPFEQQTVDTMLKCIAVASANDACVAYRHSRQSNISVECTLFQD